MKWSDVPAILHGDIPKLISVFNKPPPDVTSTVLVDAVIQSIITVMEANFERVYVLMIVPLREALKRLFVVSM